MARSGLEVADILRDHGPAWRDANRGHISLEQMKVMSAIERCRTAALGGHVARCENDLLNLATNAMDAMVDNPSDARRVAIRTAMHTDSKVEVVVSDSGPGIPEQAIDEIFDTFYTTKQHGTGLGLSIVRTIVDTYGGKIWAENRSEGGAAFHFTIPLSSDMPAQPKAFRQCSARAHAEA
jgi:signal transduction histidine kinase